MKYNQSFALKTNRKNAIIQVTEGTINAEKKAEEERDAAEKKAKEIVMIAAEELRKSGMSEERIAELFGE